MSRTSHSQFAQIVDFMERNGDLSTPGNTALGRFTAATKWEELTDILNSDGSGMPKKVDKWKKVWSDYKNNTKKKAKRIQRATCCPEGGPKHVAPLTDLEKRVLVLTHNELLQVNIEETPNLSLVMQCCITLIQSHGSVVERVIDDPAFQKILTLTSLTAEERGRVTSEGVRGMMEGEEEDCEETDTSEVQEHANETETQDPTAIKDEIGVIHWQCSCDEISGRHDDACAAAAVDYLQHYRISLDEATCAICDETFTWKSVATLREHLQRKHPDVTVIGDHDDAEIPNAPPSPPNIVLTKVDPLGEIPPANKKRKFDPAADNEPIITQHDVSSLDRFKGIDHPQELKSLDQFGLYVASLLKLLPRKRCIKYQNQIVDRLLKDLAAAA
ncbi:uncharacterized protein LOC119692884 isoform X2 [Plutella xylostella]|uniref:uncharacterized protein LOC119692884 isoform X2 n=1 Tax=Plutella xylostella TaxID=51655 RepID=UPI0020325F01|nr:uncharacterized protein LOC119692884 isoform X2 [Plutella xylostella]